MRCDVEIRPYHRQNDNSLRCIINVMWPLKTFCSKQKLREFCITKQFPKSILECHMNNNTIVQYCQ